MTLTGSPRSVRSFLARSDHVRVAPQVLHLGHVDRDRERARPARSGRRSRPRRRSRRHGRGHLHAEQAGAEPGEVVRAGRGLEADQVGAEHPPEQLGPAGQLHEQLGRRERDVHEEADAQVGSQLAEQRRHQLQVVVLHPDHRVALGVVGGDLGEPPVHPLVRLPPAAVEGRRLDRVVVERPERGVGVALVVVLVVVAGQRHGSHPDTVGIWYERRGIDPAGPADPRPVPVAQDRVQRADQPARAARPGGRAVREHRLVDRQPIGDDQQGSSRHCEPPVPPVHPRARVDRGSLGGIDQFVVFLLTQS